MTLIDFLYKYLPKRKLKYLNFYFNFHNDLLKTKELVEKLINSETTLDKEKIYKYLTECAVLVGYLGVVRDPFVEGNPGLGGMYVHTDGVWAWHNYMAEYYRKYSLELPQEFVEYIRKKDYRPYKKFAGILNKNTYKLIKYPNWPPYY